MNQNWNRITYNLLLLTLCLHLVYCQSTQSFGLNNIIQLLNNLNPLIAKQPIPVDLTNLSQDQLRLICYGPD